jgi:hypothetical protein
LQGLSALFFNLLEGERAARSLRTFNPVTCKPRQPGTAEMPESQARPIITVVQHKSGMWARSLNQAEREMFERLQCALASCQFTCMAPQLQSTITCPNCGYQATEVMPTDACVALYECNGCGETLKPLPGSCCVFCSYGSVPCPPIQEGVEPCCTPQPDQKLQEAATAHTNEGESK